MTETTQQLCAKLDALYEVIKGLTPTSPEEDFASFASFFSEDCKVFLKSMNLHGMPGVTRQGAIDDMKETLEKQRLDIMGQTLEPFFETEVVTFNGQGLIQELKLYNCWSPIVRIVQDKTGKGPYSEGEARAAWENMVKGMAQKKRLRREELLSAVCCT